MNNRGTWYRHDIGSVNADPDPAFFLIADPDPVVDPGF
jgi:hypothetical protein